MTSNETESFSLGLSPTGPMVTHKGVLKEPEVPRTISLSEHRQTTVDKIPKTNLENSIFTLN